VTAIVGIAQAGRTWIGGDSCVTLDQYERATTASPKVWRQGPWLVGIAGGGAWAAVIRAVKWPSVPSLGWPEAGLPRALLQAANELGIDLDDGELPEGAALIGGAGGLWLADNGLFVDRYEESACGSGGTCARAVLHVIRGRPRHRIQKALEAAAAIVPGVAGPFIIEQTP